MLLGLINFLLTRKNLGPIGREPENVRPETARRNQMFVYVGSILSIPLIYMMITNTAYTDMFMYIIGPTTLAYLLFEMRLLSREDNKKVIAALIFIFLSIIFWAFFEQSGGSLSLYAEKLLSNEMLGLTIDPNVVNNSSNSLFVIVFSALIGAMWIWLQTRGWEPNYFVKFGLAFIFLGLAFFLFYSTRFTVNSSGLASLGLFTFAYFVISIGELFLSPIGLSLMTKLSPKRLWGVMMGMWFLASSYGQYVAGLLGAGMASPNEKASLAERMTAYTDGYYQLAIYAFITGGLVIVFSFWMNKLMKERE
jgi:POT family proton-dependent oligopeptide transporter